MKLILVLKKGKKVEWIVETRYNGTQEKHYDQDTYLAHVFDKTIKETYEKVFDAEMKYEIDPNYSIDEKICITNKPEEAPEQFKDKIEEFKLDYW